MRPARLVFSLILGLACVVPAGTSAAHPPRLVRLDPIEGLPPDRRSREEFLAGVQAAFAQATLPTLQAGTPGDLAHDFELADTTAQDAWELHVVIGAPPLLRDIVRDKKGRLVSQKPNGRRASRGLTVVLTVRSPEAVEAGARPTPERIGLVLPEADASGAPRERSRGVEYRWDQAGLATGRVALEALVRAAGDAPDADWAADLQPVRRMPSPR